MMSTTEEVHMQVSKKKRSLRKLPPTYSLSLVFCHRNNYRDQTFCTLSDGGYHVTSVPEMRRAWCITSTSYGWLMMMSHSYCSPSSFYLFNPVTLSKIYLPPLPHYHISRGLLTSSPTDPNCVVMLFNSIKKSLNFCRIGDKKWVQQSLKPLNKSPIHIKHDIYAVSCEGKIYLFFWKGMAVIHNINATYVSIEPHELEDAAFFSPLLGTIIRSSDDYLESCGEIFYVRGRMFGLGAELVQTFDVFKLELSTMSWVKVESLDDRIFLLNDRGSMSVSAAEMGLKGNCIYFVLSRYTCLYRFDMYEGTITVTLPCPKKFPSWCQPFWVVPDCKLQITSEKTCMQAANDERNKERSWEGLPTDLLDLIMASPLLDDCIRFRLSCKSRISISPQLRSNHLPMRHESGPQLPWLISFPKNNKGVCNFYHPIYSDAYTLNIPELAGAILLNAKYGWLLMSRGSTSIFLFNPFTMEIVNLPDLQCRSVFQSIFFSSSPTSSEFVVFGLKSHTVLVYHKGENSWRTYLLRSQPPLEIFSSPCNPVFYGGVYYFLCADGTLGLFNPETIEEESQWEVFLESKVSCVSSALLMQTSIRNFIVEYNGEILAVFVSLRGKPIWVFKLDHPKMKWDRLESLGDKVLFLSHTASTLIPAELKGIENRIYFPRLHGQDNLFYSLSTHNYHSFGRKDSRGDWLNTTEHWHCAWIHPTA